MKKYMSQSTVYPTEIDKFSSNKYVYVNSDIGELQLLDDCYADDNYTILYEYSVTRYTNEEYLQAENELLSQQIAQLQLAVNSLQRESF